MKKSKLKSGITSLKFLQCTTLSISLLNACGPNAFEAMEKKDPAEKATVALENGDAQKAIDILSDALADDPTNQQYISILSMAYAQRAGLDPLTLAQNMATSQSTGLASSSNGITSLFSIMPTATDAHIADVDQAVTLLISIPSADRKSYDTLKLAMFQTAAMTLRTKALDKNGDGELTADELLSMSTSSATSLLNQLASAAVAFSGATLPTGTTDAQAAAQITAIQSAISSQPGASDEEKLKNYLARSRS
jgi:hypothetical protein